MTWGKGWGGGRSIRELPPGRRREKQVALAGQKVQPASPPHCLVSLRIGSDPSPAPSLPHQFPRSPARAPVGTSRVRPGSAHGATAGEAVKTPAGLYRPS